MTERFKLGVDEQYGAILDNDKIMSRSEIVELLNELHEENQGLKSSNMEYEDALARLEETNNELVKENEQLKQENKKLADALTVYFQSKIKGDVE